MQDFLNAPSEGSSAQADETDITARLQGWCADLRARLPGLVEVALLRLAPEGSALITAAPEDAVMGRIGYREAVARMRAAQAAVLLPLDRTEDGIAEVIAMPVKSAQAASGASAEMAVLVGVAEMPAARVQLIMAQLEVSLGWLMFHLGRQAMAETRQLAEIHEQAFLICAEMLDTEKPTEARQILASLLAKYLKADRVVLVRRGLFGLRIQSISGESKFDRKSQLNDLTRQVAHEAQLRRAPIRWRRSAPEKASLMGRLGEMHGDAAIDAVPLTDALGNITEVVVLHWSDEAHLPDIDAWSVVWTLARPILAEKDRAAHGFAIRNLLALKTVLKRLLGPRAFKLKLITAALVAAVLGVAFVQVENTLRADVVIDDPDLRVISAPIDGFIDEVFVIPGDRVSAGQALLQLEDDEIRLRIAELEAQRARHVARAALARSNRDRAEAAVAEAEQAETEARLSLARRELAQTVISARTDGIVLEGDLRQRLGARVTFGEELMRIAPQQGIEVQLSVRNRDGDRLAIGLQGRVRLEAAPDVPLSVQVTRLQPRAETIDGELRFVAFGELAAGAPEIENGMQGAARLDMGQATIYAVWVRPILETVYMFLWRWLP
jgi:AraC-like DNA-binding protein